MNATTFIYFLSDPFTGEIRYVGKAKDIWVRIKTHLNPRYLLKTTLKNSWIKHLLSKGGMPNIKIITEVQEDNWYHAERLYIAFFKHLGFDLTNGTLGGDGRNGYKTSDETKAKLSKIGKGRPMKEETKAKLSLWNKENKDKVSPNLGKRVSEETRAKMRQAAKLLWSKR